jgi:hypothetical protein
MNRIFSFLAQAAAGAATLLAFGLVIHPAAMIFAPPVVIATVVVGVLLATSLALFDRRSAPSLLGDAGVGVLAGVVIWVATMLSADFLGRTFSVALAGVAAALVRRSTRG